MSGDGSMSDAADPAFAAGRPDPTTASTPGEFVGTMRRLKEWSGLAYRQLEKRAAAAGQVLPRSTLTAALTRDVLPREELVATFTRTCGCGDDEVRQWVAARRRIAAAADPTAPEPDVVRTGASDTDNRRAVPAGLVPPGIRDASWAMRFLAVALVALVALVAVAAAVRTVRDLAGSGSSDGGTPYQVGGSSPPETGGPAPVRPPSPLPEGSQLSSPLPAPDGAPTVLYVGDSLAMETSNMIRYVLHSSGRADLVSVGHPGAAICDFLAGRTNESPVPAEHKLPALVKSVKPRVVALQFTGGPGDIAGCAGAVPASGDESIRRYRTDAQQAVAQIGEAARAAGIDRPKLVWVLQGPDRGNPQRPRRLNEEVFNAVANANGDLVSDAGWHVSLAAYPYESIPDGRYKWTQFLPCTDAERRDGYCTLPQAFGGVTQLHKNSDDLHFCLGIMAGSPPSCDTKSPGAIRYGAAIANTITQYLGR
jgi:hypothetical protein